MIKNRTKGPCGIFGGGLCGGFQLLVIVTGDLILNFAGVLKPFAVYSYLLKIFGVKIYLFMNVLD